MMEPLSNLEHAGTETPNEVLLSDEQRDWHNRIGPCPGCGKRLDYSHEECVEMIETDDRLAKDAPGLARQLRAMSVHCDTCAIRLADEARVNDRRERAVHIHIHTFASGLLPEVCRGISFDKSNKAMEADNTGAWALGRKGFSGNLWLHGDRGTGKTHLARCILKRELMEGYTVSELKAMTIENAARELHTEKVLDRYTKTRWLLIDDLDKLAATERSMLALFNLLDKRYENKGRLLITSNASLHDTKRAWQSAMDVIKNTTLVPALLDRIHPVIAEKMTGTSLRKEAVL